MYIFVVPWAQLNQLFFPLVLLQHGADSSLLNTDRKAPIDLANGQAREVLLGK